MVVHTSLLAYHHFIPMNIKLIKFKMFKHCTWAMMEFRLHGLIQMKLFNTHIIHLTYALFKKIVIHSSVQCLLDK